MTNTTTAKLIDIADRLARLAPCHRDPHRFHEQKSELVNELRALAANDNAKPRIKRSGWL
ncbi:MAG: hypothetical protein ACK4P4_02915 [Allorhizobium sp.]